MKKQAKKKAATKKKATKKKVTIKNIVITLKQKATVLQLSKKAKRHKPGGPGDKVRWWNKTANTLKLTFNDWPFVEQEQAISIAAGQKSPWFSIDPGTRAGRHVYVIVPSIADPSAPPDSPAVIVEG